MGTGARTDPLRLAVAALPAVADQETGNGERAADRYADAFDDLCHERRDDGVSVWERLHTGIRARGRFRLIEAGLLLAEGRPEAARAVFEEGFEVADLREGAEAIREPWSRVGDEPLPPFHDFRMRPET